MEPLGLNSEVPTVQAGSIWGKNMVDIIRLRNPNAFQLPELEEFVQTALRNIRYGTPKAKMMESLTEEHIGVLLARQDGEWCGLAWVDNGAWERDGVAAVLHFYSTGGKVVRETLIAAVVEFARSAGADKLLAWDMNQKPGAFGRIFRSAGPVKEVMRAYEFDLSKARV